MHVVIAEVEQCVGRDGAFPGDGRENVGSAQHHLRVAGGQFFVTIRSDAVRVNLFFGLLLFVERADRMVGGHLLEIDGGGTHVLVVNIAAIAGQLIVAARGFDANQEAVFEVAIECFAGEL